MRTSRIVAALGAGTLGVSLFTGCVRSEHAASMGLLAPREQPLVLGSGDALGVRIYVNDLVIAARSRQDQVVQQAIEQGVNDDLEELIDLLVVETP